MSDKELQYKRERGLCFKCDAKWHVGHRCARKELSVLLTQDGEEDYEYVENAEPLYLTHYDPATTTNTPSPPSENPSQKFP